MVLRFRPLKLLQYATLIGLEATLVHFVVRLITFYTPSMPLRWEIVVVVLAVATLVTTRFEPLGGEGRIRITTAAIAGATILWALAAHAVGLEQSWRPAALRELVRSFANDLVAGYLVTCALLWAWWRGTSIADVEHADVLRLVRRGIVVIAIGLVLLTPTSFARRPGVVSEIVLLLLLAFSALSVTRIAGAEGEGVRTAQWRWLRSSMLSTLVTVAVGLAILAAVTEPVRRMLREALLWFVYGIVVLVSPLVRLVYAFFDMLLSRLVKWVLGGADDQSVPPTGLPGADELAPVAPPALPDALVAVPVFLLALIPLVTLVLLIMFRRRRRSQPVAGAGETHESIFSWSDLVADLGSLLGGLRLPRRSDDGLRGVLERLRGADPVARIRRRYVELLLLGEAAGRQRKPSQTPHEFEPDLMNETLDARAIDTLTDMYEQARYAPHTIDDEAAARADAAWRSLRRDASATDS